jgi:hypothetical protein
MQPRFTIRLALAGGLLAYCVFLLWYMCPYAGGSDSSGYLNSARLLHEGRLTATPRIPAEFPLESFGADFFTPTAFKSGAVAGTLVPTYSVGLPLHVAAMANVTGLLIAPTAVNLLAVLAFVWLFWALAGDFGVVAPARLIAVSLLLLSPLTVLYSLQAMSDLLATVWAMAVMLCAWRAPRHWGWALAAGAAIAVAVMVRPTNALLFLPTAICLGISWRTWLPFGLGGLPGAVFLCYYNFQLYGKALTTGYGNVNGMFNATYVGPTLLHYAVWLPVVLTPLVVAGLALPFVAAGRKPKLVLSAWAGAFVLFYAAYACTHETWWYLRFVLPALPALAIGGALVLQRVRFPTLDFSAGVTPQSQPPRALRLRLPLGGTLLVLAFVWQLGWCWHFQVHKTELGERCYRDAGAWVQTSLPANSLIAANQISGALFYYSDKPFIAWDRFTPQSYAALNDYLVKHQLALYAGLFDYEEDEALKVRMPGIWIAVAHFRQVTIWRRSGVPAPANGP